MEKVSTSHIERMNLNIRMQNRRMTRLTNAFFKVLVQPSSGSVALSHLLQLLPGSSDIESNASDGSRNHGSCSDNERDACVV
jgi:hypothetical protein